MSHVDHGPLNNLSIFSTKNDSQKRHKRHFLVLSVFSNSSRINRGLLNRLGSYCVFKIKASFRLAKSFTAINLLEKNILDLWFYILNKFSKFKSGA